MMRSLLSALALTLALGALPSCDALDPTSFERIRQSSEIVIARSPGGGNGATGFGAVLLGFGTSLPDTAMPARPVRASRFAVSGGASGPYAVYAAFDEHVVDARTTSGLLVTAGPDARYTGCVAAQFCGEGSSISFAETDVWHQDAATTRQGCVIVPSGSAIVDSRTGDHREQVQIRCEPSSSQVQPIDVPVERVNFGVSATSLPDEHPLGAAIFGAPGDARGNGGLYRLDDYPLNGFVRVDLAGTPPGAGIGRTMASAALADGTILLATGASDRPDDPLVVVATLDTTGTAVLRACLRGHGTRYGSSLAFGDFDEDGVPDLAIGAGVWQPEQLASQHVDQPIDLFSGDALVRGRALGCELPPATPLSPARTLPCASDTSAGFVCAAGTQDTYTGFGASIAAGDVNADGHVDLVVGAPLSNVRAAGAGVVRVFAGGGDFASLGEGTAERRATLTYSSIATGARLGAAVSLVPGVDRFEIVAGAPGASRVALFLCSGIVGDRPQDFAGRSVTHGCVLTALAGPGADAGTGGDAGGPRDAGTDAGAVRDAGTDAGDDAARPPAQDAGDVDADVDAG